jgi:mono/diheme cytochrome c family protein
MSKFITVPGAVLAAVGILILAFYVPIVSSQESQTAQEPAGKKVFLDSKCNMCHQVESQGIMKKGATSMVPPAEIKGGSDLSNVGEKGGEWITKYLKKEVDLNEKKHSKTWSGKEEDLTALVKWLETLKKK